MISFFILFLFTVTSLTLRKFPRICEFLQVFLLLLISNFPLFWSANILCMTTLFLSWLRLVLWIKICPLLENGLCALEKNVYPGSLDRSLRICSVLLVVQVFCSLADLLSVPSISKGGVLKSPPIVFELPISPFNSMSVAWVFGLCFRWTCVYHCDIFLMF